MKLIGLTGPSGSGKGYVSLLFAKQGIPSIDTDAIVHRLYREDASCIASLEEAFGPICGEDGGVDRRKLAAIVFADRESLALLNRIVHRLVWQEVEKIAAAKEADGCEFLLLDAPQLYEAGMESLCHKVIAVTAPLPLRLERICKRDGLTREAAEARIRNQHNDAFFKERADYLICNDGVMLLSEQIDRIMGELKQ